MIWVDKAIVGLLAIYCVSGFVRGYSQELFSLCVWGVGIVVGWFFSNDFAILLAAKFPNASARPAASFVCLTLITLTLGWLINVLLTDSARPVRLTIVDRLGGIVIGVLHGLTVAFVLVLIAGLTPLPKENWWDKSHYLPPFQLVVTAIRDNIPTKLAASIKYR